MLSFPGGSPQLSMFGTPNNWSVDANGNFTKDVETAQFRAALGYVRDLYAMGVYYPDPNLSVASVKGNFLAGQVAIMINGWGSYQPLLWDPGLALKPPIHVRTLRPFSADGGHAVVYEYPGVLGKTAVKKGSPDRVKELLRILNFLAAPFGSQESLLLEYGLPGVDFNFDDGGNPVPTDHAKVDLLVPWQYLVFRNPVLFSPVDPDYAKVAYADQQAALPVMIADPSVGLYSPTDSTKGGQLTQRFADGLGDLVTGRGPLTDLDSLVRDWKTNGGDQIRIEYQKAYAAAH
jgi:putative aldouronate transport system substrate-binding protein